MTAYRGRHERRTRLQRWPIAAAITRRRLAQHDIPPASGPDTTRHLLSTIAVHSLGLRETFTRWLARLSWSPSVTGRILSDLARVGPTCRLDYRRPPAAIRRCPQAAMTCRAVRRRRGQHRRAAQRAARKRGRQPGAPGSAMSWAGPDEVMGHHPGRGMRVRQGPGRCARPWRGPVVPLAGDPADDRPARPARPARGTVRMRPRACGAPPAGMPGAAASIGPNLRALVVYLLVFQHVPVQRCRRPIDDVTGAAVPTGTALRTPAAMPRHARRSTPGAMAACRLGARAGRRR